MTTWCLQTDGMMRASRSSGSSTRVSFLGWSSNAPVCGLGSAGFVAGLERMAPLIVGPEPGRIWGLRREGNLLWLGWFPPQEVDIGRVKTSVVDWSDITASPFAELTSSG